MSSGDRICPWLKDPLQRLEAAASSGRLGHGWLIGGARGVGKLNLALTLANRLLRGDDGSPPGVASPSAVLADYAALSEPGDRHPDLHRVRAEEDRRTIAVQQIRELIAELVLTPHMAGMKVVVIEGADTMTTEAANALLKSLEEPTPNTYLFLLAERPGRLPATIRSRCQKLQLKSPALATVRAWLADDGLRQELLPTDLLARSPIGAAALLSDPDTLSNYNVLQDEITKLCEGRANPHELAERWQRGDVELALDCLIGRLADGIRHRLVAGLSNPVTDAAGNLMQNFSGRIPEDALFAGLQMAENLREQLGRGLNVELALKSLLTGLERPAA